MPIDQVVCVLCKNTVSKRRTLSLEVLGGGEGRACRNHEAVRTLAQECASAAQLQRQASRAERRLRVMIAAAGVRVVCTVTGQPPEFVYDRLRYAGYPPAMLEEIQKEVDVLGGPTMTPEEFGESLMIGVTLMEKKS